MPTYYTFIPNSELTAEVVDAPNTRRARTAFLDFLTRNNYINYDDRGRIRDSIKTARVEQGETSPSVTIFYKTGQVESNGPEIEVPSTKILPPPEERAPWSEDYLGEGDETVDEFMDESVVPREEVKQEEIPSGRGPRVLGEGERRPGIRPNPFQDSPIARVSRQTGTSLFAGIKGIARR